MWRLRSQFSAKRLRAMLFPSFSEFSSETLQSRLEFEEGRGPDPSFDSASGSGDMLGV